MMNMTLRDIAKINNKVKRCYLDLEDILNNLQHFEKAYKMSTAEFRADFTTGKLTHETDFFEWHAYLGMSEKLLEKIRELEKELGNALEQKLLAKN